MPDWLSEIESEKKRVESSPNPGRVRTAARRIAGIALREYQKRIDDSLRGEEFIRLLQSFGVLEGVPGEVAYAALRLSERLSSDFTSPSVDPLGDAALIVEYVKRRIAGTE